MERDFAIENNGLALEVYPCTVQVIDYRGAHPKEERVCISLDDYSDSLDVTLTKEQAKKLAEVLLNLSK